MYKNIINNFKGDKGDKDNSYIVVSFWEVKEDKEDKGDKDNSCIVVSFWEDKVRDIILDKNSFVFIFPYLL
ncbi:MAG: hypothetical protein PUD83_06000 [Bacteroidales bacterium]|nr:hypothetical protein [Bacteroidales bacterium]